MTDNPNYEKQKIKRLFFYVLGVSPIPLSIKQIEKKIKKKVGPGRQNYVYQIRNNLAPIGSEVTNILLLKNGDFFDKNNELKFINLEDEEKQKRRIKTKVFEAYGSILGWNDITKLTLQKKEIKCNHLCLEFVISSTTNKNDVKIFLSSQQRKSMVFINGSQIPIIEKRRGANYIYSILLFPYISLRRYVDMADPKKDYTKDDEKEITYSNYIVATINETDSKSILRNSNFTLNLRGFLHYLLLNYDSNTKNINEKPSREINEVLANLSRYDKYHDMENEFTIFDPLRKSNSLYKNTILIENKKSCHYIKKRFPFLSFYNEYKMYLPENFAIVLLTNIALELKNKLEELGISEIKYHVTEKFFAEIENHFWVDRIFSIPRIEWTRIIDDNGFSTLEKYQKEIRTYLTARLERQLESFKKKNQDYNTMNYQNYVSRKVHNMLRTNNEKFIIPVSDLFKYDDKKMIISAQDFGIIQNICNNDSRLIVCRTEFLIRLDILKKKIKPLLRSEMTVEEIDFIFRKFGIPEKLWNKGFCGELTDKISKELGYEVIPINLQNKNRKPSFRIVENTDKKKDFISTQEKKLSYFDEDNY